MTQPDRSIPDKIVVSRDRLQVKLLWSDGNGVALSAPALRAACRCAWCTRDRVLDRFAIEASTVAFADIATLGCHGLHITFSDGHERGIFPWAYLADLARQSELPPPNAVTHADGIQ